MRYFLLVVLFCADPALAETDFFQTLSGSYGMPFSPTMDCKTNPHRVSFFDGNRRVRFEWQSDIQNYAGNSLNWAEYSVQGITDLGIGMALDGESRLTEAGTPVVWVMRPVQGFDGYCWGRTDWPDARCIAPHIRCPNASPTS